MIALGNLILKLLILKARLLLGFSIIGILGCENKTQTFELNGYTMGTTYSVVYLQNQYFVEKEVLQQQVDSLLNKLNLQMSTYIENSEISQFNSLNEKRTFTPSSEFFEVVSRSQNISNQTRGAFDITIMPLVNLWGFGPGFKKNISVPKKDEIDEILKNSGFKNLIVSHNSISKKIPSLKIDLNAVAKGFAVDCVSELLEKWKIRNYLVEIGGEIRCLGANSEGNFWTVGIDKPISEANSQRKIESILKISNSAVATSGDYRNFFEDNGTIYSHIINPYTGYPVKNRVASATVIAPFCTEADAWATALLVMGEDGIEKIENLEGYEAILYIRKENKFQKIMTSGINSIMLNP